MADEPNPPTPDAADASVPPSREAVDELLNLCERFSRAGLSLSVTLGLPCGVLSGRVISQRAYVAQFKEQLRTGFNALTERETGEMLDTLLGVLPESDDMGQMFEGPNAMFLHLTDAKYIFGGAPPVPSGGAPMFVRVRVSQIAAWSFGALGPPSEG